MKISSYYIKKFGAVLGLLFRACDYARPACGPLVSEVKVGVLKGVMVAMKALRPLWTAENLHQFVMALDRPNVLWLIGEF